MSIENGGEVADDDPLLAIPRCHIRMLVYYVGRPPVMEGSLITTVLLNYQPTFCGTVTLESADLAKNPAINHRHLSTEKDRYCLRVAVSKAVDYIGTKGDKEMVSEDFLVREGWRPLGTESTDEEIDESFRSLSV